MGEVRSIPMMTWGQKIGSCVARLRGAMRTPQRWSSRWELPRGDTVVLAVFFLGVLALWGLCAWFCFQLVLLEPMPLFPSQPQAA